jgi:hypothetical protein
MVDLRAMLAQTQQSKDDFAAAKKAEREEMSGWSDEKITAFTSDPAQYQSYLDFQADNPNVTPGNLALARAQIPDCQKVNSMKRWNDLGRQINKGERGFKVFVRENYMDAGVRRAGYAVGRMFEIAQTKGKPLPRAVLENDTPDMQKALAAVIKRSPVQITLVDEGLNAVTYAPANKVIYCPANLSEAKTLEGLISETTQARLHNDGAYIAYTHDGSRLDAQSVAYMVCRRFGIEAEKPDVRDVAAIYEGTTAADRRLVLDSLKDMAEQIGDGIQLEIAPPDRSREKQSLDAQELQKQ